MKKIIFTLLAFLPVVIANAQCTPDGSSAEGLRPSSSSVPCAIQGQSFSQTYTIKFWSQVTFSGNTSNANSWRIDSINNLPAGLSVDFPGMGQTFSPGDKTCFTVSGTPTGICGQYVMRIRCTANIGSGGGLPISFVLTDAGSGSVSGFSKPFIRVFNSGSGCPAVDGQQTANFVPYSGCLPSASTDAATDVTSTSVKLNGTVNANSGLVNISFDWGPSTAYGSNNVASPSVLNSSTPTQVSTSLFGLNSFVTYHYRTKVTYGGGAPVYGNDQQFYTTAPSGIDNTIADFVKIYPNPSNNELTIETGTGEPRMVSLVNLLGEKVITTNTTGTQTKLNTENLEEGVYTLTIQAAQQTKSSRIIVMH